ncbi:hypothetical protein [Methylosinus sp. R-45379]|jgi:ElaB/YqjD/DUF883 family membrane-anchored ribosome-binding protein|uniref:hypothetical protein n=1 Tax=Methylosinus sp. R-45379 TaxID=980563 RepID=UPI0007C94FB9|nr:hypothetical protein [Methylosinus sp. R-45379]
MKKLSIFAATVLLCGTTAAMAVPNSTNSAGNQSQGATNQQTIDSRVTAIFSKSANANGGAEMTAELKALLTTNPELAADVTAASKKANLDQKVAAGKALAQAEQALKDAGNTNGANKIKSASDASDEQTLAAYQAERSQVVASDDGGEGSGRGGRGGFGNGGNYGGGSGGGSVSGH